MGAEPRAELLDLPREYGTPQAPLHWSAVRERLTAAEHYWLATVRPDGRPHVVPLDGVWIGDRWYFGGSPATVKHRNLKADPRAVLHLEDAGSAVIVEGVCDEVFPDGALARALSEQSKAKYGYGPTAAKLRRDRRMAPAPGARAELAALPERRDAVRVRRRLRALAAPLNAAVTLG